MFKPSKSVLSFGAGALALGVLMLAAPRAAHAIAAALVQVTNTAANPAITQSVASQAAQLVELNALVTNSSPYFNVMTLVAPNGDIPTYTVPSNQALVITAADLSPIGCSGTAEAVLNATNTLKKWYAPYGLTTHFEYPSGIVFPASSSPNVSVTNFANSGCSLYIELHGYLTFN